MAENPRAQIVIRTVAVAGLIVILVLIGAAVSSKPRGAKGNFFSSLFSGVFLASEKITVSADPRSVASGGSVTVSWTHQRRSTEGSYDLSYACHENSGLYTENGSLIPCNSAFPVNEATSVRLIARSLGATPVELPLTVTFTPAGGITASLSGSAVMTVTPEVSPAPVPPPIPIRPPATGGTPTPSFGTPQTRIYPGGSTRIDPNGLPDLIVQIIDVGVLTSSATSTESQFRHSNSVGIGEKPAILFDIKNAGTNVASSWRFTAQLPTANGNFLSDIQAPLAPGNGVRFTIGFDEGIRNPGGNPVTITVDPGNELREFSESNNTAAASIFRGY